MSYNDTVQLTSELFICQSFCDELVTTCNVTAPPDLAITNATTFCETALPAKGVAIHVVDEERGCFNAGNVLGFHDVGILLMLLLVL